MLQVAKRSVMGNIICLVKGDKMKKITLLLTIIFATGLMFAQAPCCKNKASGASCTHTAITKTADVEKAMPACCKAKSAKGLSCCKNKQGNTAASCTSKKWWQVWKKSCCAKL